VHRCASISQIIVAIPLSELSTVGHLAATIGTHGGVLHRRVPDLDCGARLAVCVPYAAFRGELLNPGLEEPAMFKLPAYDPVGIALLGFVVLAVAAMAFVY